MNNATRMDLEMPPSNTPAMESAQAFMAWVAGLDVLLCPCCKALENSETPVQTPMAPLRA